MSNLNNVRVAGWVGPFADTDTYYCTDPLYGIDGLRSVPDKATRDAITQERRRQGMLVVVQQDFGSGPNTIWQLNAPPWNNTDTDWIQFISSTITSTVGGDLSGTLPDPTVVSTNGIPFGTMATQNASSVAITGGTVTGLPTPISGSDAASKSYVDAATTGLSAKGSSRLASVASLSITYNNGAAGVGATLTNSGAFAAFTLDGVSANLNDRVLVKNQTTQAQNGIYSVTTVGSGTIAWVLTRTTDFNSSSTVSEGSYTVVSEGTTNSGTLWLETGIGPFTVGTTPIIFTEMIIGPISTTLTGDVTGSGSGSIATTVTKTNGVLFALSATTDTTNAANILSGIVSTARLGTGTADNTTFLRGDNTWQPISVGLPVGSDQQVQFNRGGALSSYIGFTYNYTTNILTVPKVSGDGSLLLNLNANNLVSGIVSTAHLGTGTADATTFLRGDNTWQPALTPTSPLNANNMTAGTLPVAQLPTTGLIVNQHTGPITTVTQSSGNVTFNFAATDWQLCQLNANATLINGPAVGQQGTIILQQAASGGPYSISNWFSGTIIWMGPPYAAPAMPTTANAYLVATIKCISTGVYLAWWLQNSAV